MRPTLLLFTACLLFAECSRTAPNEKSLLARADSLIDTCPDSALHLLHKITSPSKLNSSERALYALLMSQEMDRCGQYVESDTLIRMATDFYSRSHEDSRTGFAYLYLSRVERNRGNAEGQAEAILKAIPFAIKSRNHKLLGTIYGEKATIYEAQQDNDLISKKPSADEMQQRDSMLRYHRLSLQSFKLAGNQRNSVISLINIGYSHYLSHHYDSALYYCQQAEHEAIPLKEPVLLSTIYRLKEGIFYYQKDYLGALHFIRLSMQTSDAFDSSKWRLIAMIYLQTGELDSTRYYLNKCITSGNELAECYQLYQQLSEKRGLFKEALRYSKLASVAKDSVEHRTRAESFAGMEKKYNFERITLENKQLIIKNQQSIIGGIIILFICVVISFLFIIEHRHKLKLALLEENLRKTVAAKDKFFSIISHDLRNPFKALKMVSHSLYEHYQELSETDKLKAIRAINDTVAHADKLLENLLLWSLAQKIDIPYRPRTIRLNETVKEVTSLFSLTAQKKNVSMICEISDSVRINVDPNMMTTILGNLISNAIKFSFYGGNVTICSKSTDKFTEITVADEGIGISREDQQLLFRLDAKLKQNGTQNEPGSGLGLILCQEFIEKQGGTIRVESELGHGSSFIFNVLNSNKDEAG